MIKLLNEKAWICQIKNFLLFVFCRMKHNEVFLLSSNLAYVTILAFVPLLTVSFSIFSTFPSFLELKGNVESFIYESFLPDVGQTLASYLTVFVENASKMTGFGILFLSIIAISLIANIDYSLNRIWRVEKKRKWLYSFSIYWTILTLGPILIATSLVLTRLFHVTFISNEASVFQTIIILIAKVLITCCSFFILFQLVPNKTVDYRYSIFGSVVSFCLFKLIQDVFVYYVFYIASYEIIYGALASIPIVFLWMYLMWLIVLVGAECAAGLPDFLNQKNESQSK